jgi:hypothetical protein
MPAEYRQPQYDLEQSLEVARRIDNRGAGATLSSAELAAILGYTGTNNGAYLLRVAAARLFGFIEGGASAISATARAARILRPDYPETAARARIEAFREVPLYDAFLDAFRGRPLPDERGMVNTLVSRFRVPEKNARSVLARLLASADQAGLFSTAGPGRMIEPTVQSQAPLATEEPEREPAPSQRASPAVGTPLGWASSRDFPKIIEGALDLMPAGPPWEEDEYREWLDFFDKACRVYYRIRRPARTEA